MSTRWTVTFDFAQPAALAAFWRLALGYAEGSPPTGFASWPECSAHMGVPPGESGDGAYIEDPDGIGPAISFLRVPEPKLAKNRVHLDVQAGGGREQSWQIWWPLVTEAVDRLTAADATVIREEMQDGTLEPCGDGRPGGKRVPACSNTARGSDPSPDAMSWGLRPGLASRHWTEEEP